MHMHRDLAARSRLSSPRVFDDRIHNIYMATPTPWRPWTGSCRAGREGG